MADNKVTAKVKTISIAEWITIITVLFTLIKGIFQAIKEFEDPDATGESKKEAVMLFISTLIDESAIWCPAILPLKDAIMSIVAVLVDAIVKGMNMVGKFKHKDK